MIISNISGVASIFFWGGGHELSDSIHPSNIIECNSYKYSFLLFLKQINFTNCNKTTDDKNQ